MIFRDANINNYPVFRYSQDHYYCQKNANITHEKAAPDGAASSNIPKEENYAFLASISLLI